MSDPVKHTEIEDVLSSIRRLVSETGRQPIKAGDTKPQAALDRLVLTDALRVPEPHTADLDETSANLEAEVREAAPPLEHGTPESDAVEPTPAVYGFFDGDAAAVQTDTDVQLGEDAVVAQTSAPSDAFDDTGAQDAADQNDAAEATSAVATRELQRPDDPVVGRDKEGSFVFGSVAVRRKPGDSSEPSEEWPMFEGIADKIAAEHQAPWANPETTLYAAAGITGGSDAAAEPDVTAGDDAVAHAPGAVAGDSPVVDDPIGDVSDSADVPDTDVEDVPDTAAADVPDTGAEEVPETVAADVLETDVSDTPEDFAETDAVTEPAEDSPKDIRPLTEKIAALEEVIGQTDEQWEPDDPGADDYAGTEVETLEWEDSPEDDPDVETDIPMFRHTVVEETAEPVASKEQSIEVVAETTSETLSEDANLDETTLDEAALRQLVSDIVREELQGVLGERITRNVRKLVRREIHRALALQELE